MNKEEIIIVYPNKTIFILFRVLYASIGFIVGVFMGLILS